MDIDDLDDKDLLDVELKPTKTFTKDDLKTWVEKYRPTKLEDVVYQIEVISALKNIIESNAANLPNLLLYGPPGTGKTSTIIALSKQIFGSHYSSRVLELNASDDRGIQVVREKIRNFSQQIISNAANKSIPPIKIVILDECDSMTRDAQSALRRTMEKYSITTRFCLICNYASKIIDPIVSRCTVFRFKPLKSDLVKSTLLNVCQKEGFKISDEGLKTLINISEGDLRLSITLLQTASLIVNPDEEISNKLVCEISGFIPNDEIEKFFNICRLKSYEKMVAKVDDITKMGYSGSQFLDQLQDWIVNADELLLSDRQKSIICEQIALNDKRLLDGGDEYLQMLEVGSTIITNI